MINELTVHAVASNNKAKGVCTCTMVSAAIITAICPFTEKYRAILGVLIITLISVGILMYTKYLAVRYMYDVTYDANGLAVFVVRSRTGKRESTLLRVDLYAIISIKRLTAAELKTHKCDTGMVKYNYCPTLAPESAVLLKVQSHYERCEVLIEVTDEFIEYLTAITATAREEYNRTEALTDEE